VGREQLLDLAAKVGVVRADAVEISGTLGGVGEGEGGGEDRFVSHAGPPEVAGG
jgi:hypothetical protein